MQQYPNNQQGQGGREPQRHSTQQQQQQQQQQQHHGQLPAPGALNVDYQPHNPSQVPSQYQYPFAGMSGQNFTQPGFQMTIRRPSESGGPRPEMQQPSYHPAPPPPNNNVGSGSASSSPVNRFSFAGPPYLHMDNSGGGGEPSQNTNPNTSTMIPSEPKMGHYSNYQHPYPPPTTAYDPGQWQPPPQLPFGPSQAQGGSGQGPSSRRSTISNPSDHERPSRPSTGDAKTQMTPMVKIEPIPQEDEEDEGEEKMDHRKRKRNRTIRSCVPCHNHKRKVSQEPRCYSVNNNILET